MSFDVDALRSRFPALSVLHGGRPMAFFDGPEKELNACKAAMEIRQAMMEEKEKREEEEEGAVRERRMRGTVPGAAAREEGAPRGRS